MSKSLWGKILAVHIYKAEHIKVPHPPTHTHTTQFPADVYKCESTYVSV